MAVTAVVAVVGGLQILWFLFVNTGRLGFGSGFLFRCEFPLGLLLLLLLLPLRVISSTGAADSFGRRGGQGRYPSSSNTAAGGRATGIQIVVAIAIAIAIVAAVR